MARISLLPGMFFLLLGAGVLVALVVGAHRAHQRPQGGLDHHHTAARRPDATPLVIGPAEVTVVGPSRAPHLGVGLANPFLVGPSKQKVLVVGPPAEPTVVIRPAEPLIVVPPPRGTWDDRGWTLHTGSGQRVYEGYYQIADRRTGQPRRFRGRVIVNHREAVPYIANPPAEIKYHPKGPCFTLVNAPWFRVDWSRPARNVDDAILYVEKVLDEALNGK